jgi:hypothetical protein
MHKLALGALVFALSLVGVRPAGADVRLTIHDGLVSLAAKDATLRQILAEWARIGQTRIIDIDRIAGAPLSIEFSNVPEKQAIDMLLRTLNGYLLVPRPVPDVNASQYDRIVVLPTTAQPRSFAAGSPMPAPLPQPRFQLPPASEPDDQGGLAPVLELQQPITPNGAPPLPSPIGGPPPFPMPTGTAAPGPFGSSTPGVIVQPPQPVTPGVAAPPVSGRP